MRVKITLLPPPTSRCLLRRGVASTDFGSAQLDQMDTFEILLALTIYSRPPLPFSEPLLERRCTGWMPCGGWNEDSRAKLAV